MYHGTNAYADAYTKEGKPSALATGATPNPHPQKIFVQTNNMTETFIPELDRLIEAYDKAETLEEMKRLGAQIEEIIYNDAAWVNGWMNPAYRGGYWRYVKWPKDFNVMQSRTQEEFFLHWIDQDAKKETEEARRTGRTFPAKLEVFDQFKTN